MDVLKILVESYTSQKMDIGQLVKVLMIVLINNQRIQKNGLEDGILEAPMYLSIQMVALKSD